MNLWQSIEGLLEVELLTADPAGALDDLAQAEITLIHVLPKGEVTLRFQISRKNYSSVSALAARRGERLQILSKHGFYWYLHRLAGRPVLTLGLFLLFALVLLLPTRIFFFRVQGNQSVPTLQILSAAEQCGLTFGVNRRSIRSERVKNALLSAIPQLKWAGINTSGCVATISVAEKQPSAGGEPSGCTVSSLVASRDGVLASLTATRGTPLVHQGQAVKKGQVLISGYTDCGLAVLAQYAQGEATAFTSRVLTALTPDHRLQKGSVQKTIRLWSLIFGKKRIKLWFGSGISDRECDRMYKEYPLTLPGGFVLPVSLALDAFTFRPTESHILEEADAQAQLLSFARDYLRQIMTAGTIRTAAETIRPHNGAFVLSGSYSCLESIGVHRQEQIGETNEQGS